MVLSIEISIFILGYLSNLRWANNDGIILSLILVGLLQLHFQRGIKMSRVNFFYCLFRLHCNTICPWRHRVFLINNRFNFHFLCVGCIDVGRHASQHGPFLKSLMLVLNLFNVDKWIIQKYLCQLFFLIDYEIIKDQEGGIFCFIYVVDALYHLLRRYGHL